MLIGVAALVTWMMLVMTAWPILSLVTFLPLVGVLLILFISDDSENARRNIRAIALWTTSVTFVVSLFIWTGFDNSQAGFQFVEKFAWLDSGISYHMGVDGISMLFVILTTFLMPLCILASWESIEKRVKAYMIAFLLLETLMIGVFCALDIVLFYVFFEAGLIPMFIIIGVWGGKRRVYASFKFFLYTLAGSVLMLLAIMAMFFQSGTTDIPTLLTHNFPASMQTWLWLAFFASFAVKMPMWPVHTWLPDAHVEAPTAGSVILAAILLKMGGYGFLRFSLPMFPLASEMFAPLVFTLSVVAIIYTSLVALMQEDMKKLIAYSSVAHMGFVTMGIFAMNQEGIQGAIFQMLSHGLVSGALFLCVGVIYDRMHTREIDAYGGLVNNMPKYATVFMVFTMANVGLPGTSGFIGEFLTMLGVFQVNTWVAFFAATGVVLSAAYALWLYRQVIFGALTKESLKGLLDLSPREKAIIYPLVVLVIFFGVYPAPVFDATADVGQGARHQCHRFHRRRADRGGELTRGFANHDAGPSLQPFALDAGADPRRRRDGAADGRRLFARRQRQSTVTGLAVAVLVIAGALDASRPAGRAAPIGSAFVQDPFARFMKVLTLIGSAVTLVMSMRFAKQENFDKFEYPVLILLCTLGMMLMISANDMIALYLGLELQSLAIYVRGGDQPRQSALDRGRPEVFRPRRAVVGHAALRHQPRLRLHRQHRLPGDRHGARQRRAPAWPGLRPGLRAGRPCLQDLGGAVPYVDAGRL